MPERRNTGDRRTSDRRRAQRSQVACQIRILSAAAPSQIVQGTLLDASVSGVRLTSSTSIAVGEKLLVEARRQGRVVCNVTVQVIWSVPETAGSHTIGCESLAEMTPRQLNQLKSVAAEAASLAVVSAT